MGQVECWSRFILSQPTSSSLSSVPARLRMNNVELGRHGRSCSNVWNYRGVNTFGAGRMEELGSHPTVKPVALVADAMRDCTRRRDICQDTFSGSGTTITRSEALRRASATPFRCGPPRYGCRLGEKAQPTTARETVIALAGTFRGETGASSAANSPS